MTKTPQKLFPKTFNNSRAKSSTGNLSSNRVITECQQQQQHSIPHYHQLKSPGQKKKYPVYEAPQRLLLQRALTFRWKRICDSEHDSKHALLLRHWAREGGRKSRDVAESLLGFWFSLSLIECRAGGAPRKQCKLPSRLKVAKLL